MHASDTYDRTQAEIQIPRSSLSWRACQGTARTHWSSCASQSVITVRY